MGVWGLRGLSDQVKKWQKLADTLGISERDREIYLGYATNAKRDLDRAVSDFEEGIRIKKEGVSMGNVANKQCPMCRSTDIEQIYVTTYSFYQCNACGERFKD